MGRVKSELFEENDDTLLPDDWADRIDIPDVDFDYQEDDGNSNCEDGGCVI